MNDTATTGFLDATFERGVFRPLTPPLLREGDQVRLRVESILRSTSDLPTLAEVNNEIAELTSIYDGLSREEVAEIERVALDRSVWRTSGP